MCGINGFLYHTSNYDPLETVQKMNRAMAHRGPDAEGEWIHPKVALGHRRLSIIDTSAAGNQPFFSASKDIALVFNGEIYNYLELKKELETVHTFTTASDTEVLIAAYKAWGISCIDKLIGMFAFALWDESKEQLFLVRDRLGIKPLYYHTGEEGLLFSSEIRALLATGIPERKIRFSSLVDYLSYQTVHAPATMIESIQMLMPGHYLAIKGKDIQDHTYWDMSRDARRDLAGTPRETLTSDIRSLLQSSVQLRMRSDVPFGAFLSGGIDSSIIVALMSSLTDAKVNTFSVIFREKEYDESPFSSRIAKKFRTEHHPILLSATSFMDELPASLNAMDHPSGDGPNTYLISKMTRQYGIKMAMSGLGGDELFAGYDVFRRMKKLEANRWLQLSPRFARTMAGSMLQAVKPSVAADKIAESLRLPQLDFLHAYPLVRRLFPEKTIREMLNEELNLPNPVDKITREASSSGLDLLSQVSIAEMKSYMQNILLRDTDQMSMAHALELRVPMLDHRLVEYVLGIGDNEKYPHTAKQLLTDSFEGLLPNEVIHRPKMGFTFPWAHWMKNELRSFCEEQLQSVASISHFREGAIDELWQRFLKDDPRISWSRIWPLVVLGHWTRQHDVN